MKKIFISLLVVLLLVGGYLGYQLHSMIYQPNVTLHGKETDFLYIPTGSELKDVVNLLYEKNYVINRNSFEWWAEKKKYKTIKPGRYLIRADMSNDELIALLRSGEQVPINVIFNNIRLKQDLAGVIGRQLEADSVKFLQLLSDEEIAIKYGFTAESFLCMFIPNTYEFYWNTSSEEFAEKIAKEYKKFWNDSRKKKAKKLNLTQTEVSVLAAIVQKETKMNDEKPRVAGVYLNRLKKEMLLQADPTLIFALGKFDIHRVLNKHKKIDSPYNTYMHKGLPPGPITLPEISSIDAVLNSEQHDYLYFCAKSDFSGYHNFAKTYSQHKQNARKFQRALNKKGVYK
ncbi:MAG: aminodeoxychorismate lyase [Flavobacteriales bacterium]|nr:MAG: aminodeoxychorismate lyase [Flavobacteriales bacterium]